ncbi:hypothetical protein KBD08_04270 [Candidatus Babeliales bacterium]|nr:hypothetical protein [Candidatus Babeliales bacterium]
MFYMFVACAMLCNVAIASFQETQQFECPSSIPSFDTPSPLSQEPYIFKDDMIKAIQARNDVEVDRILGQYMSEDNGYAHNDLQDFVRCAYDCDNETVFRKIIQVQDVYHNLLYDVVFPNDSSRLLQKAFNQKKYNILRSMLMHGNSCTTDWFERTMKIQNPQDLHFEHMLAAYQARRGCLYKKKYTGMQKALLMAYIEFCNGTSKSLQNLIFHAPKSFQKAYGQTLMIDEVDLALRDVFPKKFERTCMLLFLADTKWQKRMALDYIKSGDHCLESVKICELNILEQLRKEEFARCFLIKSELLQVSQPSPLYTKRVQSLPESQSRKRPRDEDGQDEVSL